MSALQPAFFLGHGSPMNVVADNEYTQAWKAIRTMVQKPRAILAVSAHWYIPATKVTAMEKPKTIHDFYGFPQELFDIQYPAPGDPDLAQQIVELLKPVQVGLDYEWGLDHGSWGVLYHTFPDADIPVLQLSVDSSQPPAFHYELGRKLAPLREQGVMIIATGNIVHNLGHYMRGETGAPAPAWALRFEATIREAISTGNHDTLINYLALGEDARLACPTPEHYLPLLYIMALQREDEVASFPVEGIDGGSVSMLSVRLG